jgi:uncharacterized membrane protein
MTREQFLAALERGLKHLPADRRRDILADYQSYFAEGLAAGRDERKVAESLGNPARLAAELRLGHEAPRSAFRGFSALVALAMLDGLLWLPLVLGLLLVLVLTGAGAVALVYAAFTLSVLPFDLPLGGIGAVLLRGLALAAAGAAAFAAARAGVLLLARFIVRLPSSEVSP